MLAGYSFKYFGFPLKLVNIEIFKKYYFHSVNLASTKTKYFCKVVIVETKTLNDKKVKQLQPRFVGVLYI